MKLSDVVVAFNNRAFAKSWKVNSINSLRIGKIIFLVGSGKRVLDIGCYDGTISKKIKDNRNGVIGIDISEKAVGLARKKGIEAYALNIEEKNIPSSLGKFDVIIAGEIIEHLFDPDTFLKKIHKALKPKGYLVLTTPNLASIGARVSLFLGKKPWMIENDILPGKSGHIRYFTFEELQKLLSRCGFRIKNFTADSVGVDQTTLPYLATLFPSLGRILIVKAEKL